MQEMLKEVEYCRKTISTKFKKPIQMTDEKEILLRQVEQCHICGQKYKEMEKEIRVRDHCHITGCTAEKFKLQKSLSCLLFSIISVGTIPILLCRKLGP